MYLRILVLDEGLDVISRDVEWERGSSTKFAKMHSEKASYTCRDQSSTSCGFTQGLHVMKKTRRSAFTALDPDGKSKYSNLLPTDFPSVENPDVLRGKAFKGPEYFKVNLNFSASS